MIIKTNNQNCFSLCVFHLISMLIASGITGDSSESHDFSTRTVIVHVLFFFFCILDRYMHLSPSCPQFYDALKGKYFEFTWNYWIFGLRPLSDIVKSIFLKLGLFLKCAFYNTRQWIGSKNKQFWVLTSSESSFTLMHYLSQICYLVIRSLNHFLFEWQVQR
jgi:hypothetical protein